MAAFSADIIWTVAGNFPANSYSRAHFWRFDGGADGPIEVAASASPQVVPLPLSSAEAVDPEEAYIASISSCHMLWFLDIARRDGWDLRGYRDHATGKMTTDAGGRIWIPRVVLNIAVEFNGAGPDSARHMDLHHKAHDACFIANSIRTEIEINLTRDMP